MKIKILILLTLLSSCLCVYAEAPQPPKPQIELPVALNTIEKPNIESPTLTTTKAYLKKDLDYSNVETEIASKYHSVAPQIWEKYFKKQTKLATKLWKKQAILNNQKYKTSYARVLVYLNEDGSLKFYDIKSSCVPKGDTEFIKTIEESVLWKVKFEKLPSEYKGNMLVFTIKFHSNLPNSFNVKNIEWRRYGIADIEVGKEKSTFFVKENVSR